VHLVGFLIRMLSLLEIWCVCVCVSLYTIVINLSSAG